VVKFSTRSFLNLLGLTATAIAKRRIVANEPRKTCRAEKDHEKLGQQLTTKRFDSFFASSQFMQRLLMVYRRFKVHSERAGAREMKRNSPL
jgi:hypothetical protein